MAETETRPKTAAKQVSWMGRILLGAYLVVLLGFALYAIIVLWPDSVPDDGVRTFLAWSLPEGAIGTWVLLVFSAGVLGALIHALRSFYWYVGNRDLVRSWVPMYLILPLVGGALSLVFYIVIRGGLFAGQLSEGGITESMNPIGFTAVGVLVGMFSQQAILKLKEVAETLFSKPEKGEDDVAPKDGRDP